MGKWLLKQTWEEEKQVVEDSIGHSGGKKEDTDQMISANCRL